MAYSSLQTKKLQLKNEKEEKNSKKIGKKSNNALLLSNFPQVHTERANLKDDLSFPDESDAK